MYIHIYIYIYISICIYLYTGVFILGHSPNPKQKTPTVDLAPTVRPRKDFFIDNLLVQIHSIIEIILVDRPCAMEI